MSESSIFERASRMKLRFNYRGLATVEDLWDIKLEHLDAMYRGLNAELRDSQEDTLLAANQEPKEELVVSIEILRHVVITRLRERKEREDGMAKAERKRKLLEVIANKQDEALLQMDIESLQKMVEEL